jgi:hypothetical protein
MRGESRPARDGSPIRTARSPARLAALAPGVAALTLGLVACGGSHPRASSHRRRTTAQAPAAGQASTATTAPTRTRTKPRHPSPASHAKTTRSSTTRKSPTSTTHTTATTTTTRTTPAYARPLHATLVGESHHPIANKSWSYTVTATDAAGRPQPGAVETEFTFNGVVVGHETPPTHPLTHGRLHDSVTFPPAAVGHPLDLQVVVRTPIGSVTLDWFVEVRRA